jgi:dTDP-glucose 4,6-dehydratase
VHLARKERPEWQITVIDKLNYAGNKASLKEVWEEIEFIEGDICNQELIDGLVSKNDLVVHFAAESHNDNSLDDPWPFVESNLNRHLPYSGSCTKTREKTAPHLYRSKYMET